MHGELVVLVLGPLVDEPRASCADPVLARAGRVVEDLRGHKTSKKISRHVRSNGIETKGKSKGKKLLRAGHHTRAESTPVDVQSRSWNVKR